MGQLIYLLSSRVEVKSTRWARSRLLKQPSLDAPFPINMATRDLHRILWCFFTWKPFLIIIKLARSWRCLLSGAPTTSSNFPLTSSACAVFLQTDRARHLPTFSFKRAHLHTIQGL